MKSYKEFITESKNTFPSIVTGLKKAGFKMRNPADAEKTGIDIPFIPTGSSVDPKKIVSVLTSNGWKSKTHTHQGRKMEPNKVFGSESGQRGKFTLHYDNSGKVNVIVYSPR